MCLVVGCNLVLFELIELLWFGFDQIKLSGLNSSLGLSEVTMLAWCNQLSKDWV